MTFFEYYLCIIGSVVLITLCVKKIYFDKDRP